MLVSLKAVRRRVGAFIGGFDAGLANRGFQPSRAHLNTLIAAGRVPILRPAPVGSFATTAMPQLIAELRLKVQLQKLWLDWTNEADAEGFTDFYGLQRRAVREVFPLRARCSFGSVRAGHRMG